MTRLIVLNRYFFPDLSATSQLLSDLMFHLSASGVDVHVITSRQLYDNPQRKLPATDVVHDVAVHRVSTTRFGRSGLIGRAVDYLSFYGSAYLQMRKLVRPGDILLAMTDPPLCSVLAWPLARWRGAHLVNWLQDIYPEIAIELGVPILKGPIASIIYRLRDHSLKFAAANVVVGDLMADRLLARGVEPRRIKVVHNWGDDQDVAPIGRDDNPLRRLWGLDGKFVVGYSGNLGRAHEFDTMLAAAAALREDRRILFLFIGSGHRLNELAARVTKCELQEQFRFIPYQDRAQLKLSLGVPDLHWLSLRPALEGLSVPSKFYGIAAAGRAILAVTASDGEIARLVREHDCGLVIEPGQGLELAAAIRQLADNPSRLVAMGHNARALLDARFRRAQALDRWRSLLEEVSGIVSPNPANR